MITFQRPVWLAVAAALALLVTVVAIIGAVRRHRAARRLGMVRPRAGPRHWLRLIVPPACRCIALVALAVAVGDPLHLTPAESRSLARADVLILLDLSDSMAADDARPTRLDAARNAILTVLDRLPGDRTGLICFAGGAVELCPLTRDRDAFLRLFDRADRDLFAGGQSGIDTAILAALAAIDRTGASREGRGAAVLLVSDGEFHSRDLDYLIPTLKRRRSPVHCIGVGTAAGTTLRLPGPAGPVVKRDPKGDPVHTRLRIDVLRDLATRTGGGVWHAPGSLPARRDLVSGLEYPDRTRPEPGRPVAHLAVWAALALVALSFALQRAAQ